MRKAGIAPTGAETSCLIEPPCGFCASGKSSRRRQKAARCSSVAASAASSIGSRSSAVAEQVGHRLVEAARDLRGEFDQHVPRVRGGERIARAAAIGEDEFEADARHQLEAGHALAEAVARQPAAGRTRLPGSARPTNAVARERGRGNSFSAAAVMTPSVPSAPMKRSFRS